MKNAFAIAKKELNIYFATPIAYVMFTLFVVIGSYFFLRLLGAYEQASLMYMRFNSPEMMNRLNFQDAIFRALFGNLGVILIFVVPFLTMRLVAEEKKQKTIELLYSTPVTPGQIVWGKYLAALAILVCTLALTLLYPALVQLFAQDQTAAETEGPTREIVTYLSSVSHLDSFSKGTVDLKDVIYFLSICALGLFATHRAVEAHRWS